MKKPNLFPQFKCRVPSVFLPKCMCALLAALKTATGSSGLSGSEDDDNEEEEADMAGTGRGGGRRVEWNGATA